MISRRVGRARRKSSGTKEKLSHARINLHTYTHGTISLLTPQLRLHPTLKLHQPYEIEHNLHDSSIHACMDSFNNRFINQCIHSFMDPCMIPFIDPCIDS